MASGSGTTDQLQETIDAKAGEAAGATASSADSQTPPTKRSGRPVAIICLALIALVIACFFRTLKEGYFLADDFGEFGYIEKIVHGRWDLFFANWTGNYMQIPSMAVYRPWQLMSLLTCYVIGKANPFPWYAANILFYCGDAIMLFLVCKELTRSWAYWRSLTAAALAAALFIVNPLHCESVSWVVGRVDIECAFYCLTATWGFLRYLQAGKRAHLAVAIGFFWLGILTKEMAIGFPLIATALSFFAADRAQDSVSIRQRFVRMGKQCWPIWLSTAIYFTMRYLALGTIFGGYIGTIGNGQSASALQRWLDPDNYHRVFLPFAISLYHKDNIWATLLAGAYSALIAVFAVKLLRRELPLRLSLFCLAWIVSAAIPIYKLWGIGMDLEGARFCYFLTVAFSASVCMLALAPPPAGTELPAKSGSSGRLRALAFNSATAIVGAAALLLCTFVLFKVCLRTNSVWVHASREVKAVLKQAFSMATNSPSGSQMIVLGIPKNNAGAHMIYNGVTLRLGLQQPVCPENVSERFINFDPIFYGHDEYINSARFKRCLADPQVRGPFVWNSDQLEFIDASFSGKPEPGAPLALAAATVAPSVQAFADGHATVDVREGVYTFTNNQIGDGLQFNNLAIDPRQYDFLEFEYRLPAGTPATPVVFQAKWHGKRPAAANAQLAVAKLTVTPDGHSQQFRRLRLPVSHHWRWYASGSIQDLALILPPVPGIQVRNPTLLSDAALRPHLQPVDLKSDVSGVYVTGQKTQFSIDASGIPGAAQLSVEVCKPDYFFDQIEGNLADGLHATRVLQGNKFSGNLPGLAPVRRYCELRVRALDASGKPLAEYSEPVIVYTANQATIPSLW